MTTTFLQYDIWAKITDLAKKAKRAQVAVAYLGTGARRLLPLKRGDTLIVDMSLAAMRAGQTNPTEIEKYYNAGVEIHSCANLHAKVFVFDNKAIIGSSNASKNSRDNLIEAAVVSTDKSVVTTARGFVASLKGEQISPEYITLCKKKFRPPRRPGGENRGVRTQPAHPRLWVTGVAPANFSDEEQRIADKERELAKKELRSQRLFQVFPVRFGGTDHFAKTVSVGDQIIQLWEEEGKLWAYPPSRVIRLRRYVQRDARKIPHLFVFIEESRSPKLFKWGDFRRVLRKNGVTRISDVMCREITKPELKHTLLGLWPSVHA